MPNEDIFKHTHTLVVTMPNQDIFIHNTHARARTHTHIHPHTLHTHNKHTHTRARAKETGLPHWRPSQIATLDVNRKQEERVHESDGERRLFICTHVHRPSLLLTQSLFDTVHVCGVETNNSGHGNYKYISVVYVDNITQKTPLTILACRLLRGDCIISHFLSQQKGSCYLFRLSLIHI